MEKFSRRDFLKLAGKATKAAGAAFVALPVLDLGKIGLSETASDSEIRVYSSRIGSNSVVIRHHLTTQTVDIWAGKTKEINDVNLDGTTTPSTIMVNAKLMASNSALVETSKPVVNRTDAGVESTSRTLEFGMKFIPEMLSLHEDNTVDIAADRLIEATNGNANPFGIGRLILTESRDKSISGVAFSAKVDPISYATENTDIIRTDNVPLHVLELEAGPDSFQSPGIINNELVIRGRINRQEFSRDPLPEGKIQDLVRDLSGTNYDLKYSKDKTQIVLTYSDPETGVTQQVPEITFDQDGNWKRTYEFETPYGTTAEVSTDSRVDEMTIVKGAGGEPTVLDFSAWSVINGKWTREVKQGEILYDVAEAQFILQDNGSKKMSDGYGIMSESDYNGRSLLYNFLDAAFPGISHVNGNVVINDFRDVIDTGGYRWWGTDIKTLDASGQPLFIDTTNYVVHNLMSGNAILIYKNIDGKYQTIIINSNLNDLRNWSPYFKKAQI